ncbi:RNA-binding protein containing a PIN domain [Frankia sp. AiPs1]|uniref:NYN domain-containing protein n=1 Tax=Frankia sp. AiPa1 TaxID=573492 RepID=UPI00202AEC58|nr:NYN domain-containing protein [Frankia sp. AiPa1]MCL9762358.1 NYN domain-containing protein [Frankia sp. AiPa1]
MSEPLPAPVRRHVVELAARALADLPEAQVPPSLVAVRRFKPSRRARLGALPLAAAVDGEAFRVRVAAWIRQHHPELAEAVESADGPPSAAPPEKVAAVAYLLRAPAWPQLVEAAAASNAQDEVRLRADEAERTILRLTDQLEASQRSALRECDRLRAAVTAARDDAEEARRRLRASGERIRRSEEIASASVSAAEAARGDALSATREAEAEVRRLRARVSELETALAGARRDTRESRSVDDARLRVLLDTLIASAHGIRRELDLPTTVSRPADLLAREHGGPSYGPHSLVGARGRPDDDPTLIDEALTVPGVHLIVDGYNVTKRGYGQLALHSQRERLLSGLSALVGRHPDSEVTVVFDATAVVARPVGVTMPRGVRVLFSRPGRLADEEIVRLVKLEPEGRPVVVVTSDREVADNSAAAGARALPSDALLARLDR